MRQCKVDGCRRPARPRTGRSGPSPTTCVEHNPALGRPRPKLTLEDLKSADRDEAAPAMPSPGDPGAVPILEVRRLAAAAARPMSGEQRQALEVVLRSMGRQIQHALAILSQGTTGWACPKCGPLRHAPMHGADERLHCPNDGCDEVIPVLEQDEKPKAPTPWRTRAAVGEG